MKLTRKTCWRIGLCAFILYLAIYYWQSAAGLLRVFVGACVPLILGAAIAYVINILMVFYERHYFLPKSGKMAALRRPVCMLGALLTVLFVLVFVVRLVVPELLSCVNALVRQAPEAVNRVMQNPTVRKMIPADIEQRIEQKLASLNWSALINQVRQVLLSGFSGAASAMSSLFSGLVTALFALIFAVYILLGKDTLGRQCSRLLDSYLKPVWRERVRYALGVLNTCFHSYVVGQCTEAVVLGCLCIGGMMLFKFPYATMIGTLVGVTALIPVAGAYIGAGVGAFMILSVSPEKAIWFLVFIVVLQQLEGNLIYPRVVGSSIGLPGIFVLAAVTVGGAMFGVLGMLVGVPLTAALYQMLKDDIAKRNPS